ncbi:MAG: replication initiation factor domain-containing protein [Deltaproteobacteria bacterium]|nr:replication initiation factor domain-containing protein [Deltaproteobacteria bacterium]
MQYVDFHQFCFTVKKNLSPKELSAITEKYFGYPIESFQIINTYRYAYRSHYSLGNLVNIYVNGAGDNNGTTYFEIHGCGCDTLNINYKSVIADCFENDYKIVCVHLYMDDTGNILPMDRLFSEFKKNHTNRIISIFKSVPKLIDTHSRTLEFGTGKSNTQVTIYEKGLFEKTDFNWNRIELKLTNYQDIKIILQDYINGIELGALTAGILKRVLDFKVDGHQLKSRRATEKFWTDFLGDVEKRSFGRVPKPKPDATKQFQNLRKQLKKNMIGMDIENFKTLVADINSSISDNYHIEPLQLVTKSSL